MKLKTLLTGLAAVAICSATTLSAQVMKFVTITMTTYTQNTNHDNGTVNVIGNPLVKTYSTQSILNWLAQDKLAQGQWGSSIFPPGAKLAETNDTWLVVSSANDPLVDVSDILSASGGGTAVESGRQTDALQLAAPTFQTMEVVKIAFDDTSIVGGNQLSFYLQGLSTKTVTDTTPTLAGVYTETQTNKITGAAGGGTLRGTPFVCSGNATAGGKATFGKTNIATSFAPASLAGYLATVTVTGQPTIYLSWGDDTWGQYGGSTDTHADNYCAGHYTYAKTGPNTAYVTSNDIGMLSWLGTSNYVTMEVQFTSPTKALIVGDKGNGPISASVSFSQITNRVPATLAGKTLQVYAASGAKGPQSAFASDGTVTRVTNSGDVYHGTYVLTQFSPNVAIVEDHWNDNDQAGAIEFMELIFSSPTAGRGLASTYKTPAYGANPDKVNAAGTFKLQ